LADVVQVLGQHRHPLVEILPQAAGLLGVRRQSLLPPSVGDRAEQGDKRRWRRDHDPAREPVFDQRRVLLQRRAEKLLARQEQHHELRRLRELVPVSLET
jgi:hypothetical protein